MSVGTRYNDLHYSVNRGKTIVFEGQNLGSPSFGRKILGLSNIGDHFGYINIGEIVSSLGNCMFQARKACPLLSLGPILR